MNKQANGGNFNWVTILLVGASLIIALTLFSVAYNYLVIYYR